MFPENTGCQVLRKILQKHIPEVIERLEVGGDFSKTMDPKHTSRLVTEFFWGKYSKNPDLNPIENLWGIVKRFLWWNRIPEIMLINLMAMKRRCELIIEKNG